MLLLVLLLLPLLVLPLLLHLLLLLEQKACPKQLLWLRQRCLTVSRALVLAEHIRPHPRLLLHHSSRCPTRLPPVCNRCCCC